MIGSGKIEISTEEAIAVIKKSSLPTVVIEGADDAIVYRKIEDIGDGFVSLLPVGGRENVLAIFNRKAEFSNKKVVFIADQDTWIVNGIPSCYKSKDLVFTSGYSVENDIFLDVNVVGLMSSSEKTQFEEELSKFSVWFAIALNRFLDGVNSEIKIHPNNLLDNEENYNNFIKLNSGECFPENLHKDLLENYSVKIRGKSLMAIAIRKLSYKGRPVRHHHHSIMEHASSRPGDLINRIYKNVEIAIL